MYKILIIISIFSILLYAPVRLALAESMESNEITSADLAASVASSHTVFSGTGAIYASDNNSIGEQAFASATGILTTAQNSGANSIVQQSVTTHIGALSVGSPANP